MLKESEKYEKFERLAQKRVSEAMNRIRLIGNLSDKRNYSYSDEHVKEMFDALEAEIRSAKQRYKSGPAESQVVFTFKNKAKK
jgi:hypothetical protein